MEVAALGDLPRLELVEAWIKAHGLAPPKGIKRPLLELSAAWHIQARRLGGLPAATRKALVQSHRAALDRRRNSSPAGDVERTAGTIDLSPGSRLIREWNGRMYVVDVRDAGFEFDGKTYRSLSAIARRITGARWSGPRFFAS